MPKYVSTFLIGFFATTCAVFVPRMVAKLNGASATMEYFHLDFILVGIAFALVIGVVTAIFVNSERKSSGEIFMTALGMPALLVGALNSGDAANNYNSLQATNQKLSESLAQKSGIAIEGKATSIVPLEVKPASRTPVARSGFSIIAEAQAQEQQDIAYKRASLNLGIQAEQTPYIIVLEKLNSKEAAIQKAGALRKIAPQATAVQSGQNFLVIDSAQTLNKSDALLKAIELQNKTGLKPYLLRAK